MTRSDINDLLPEVCRIPTPAASRVWSTLAYGATRFPTNPKKGGDLAVFRWDLLATALEGIVNQSAQPFVAPTVAAPQAAPPQASTALQTHITEKTYHPVMAPGFHERIELIWKTRIKWIMGPVDRFRLPGHPHDKATMVRPSSMVAMGPWAIAMVVTRGANLIARLAWFPHVVVLILLLMAHVAVRVPLGCIHGLVASLAAFVQVPLYNSKLMDLPGHVQAIVYSNDGHTFQLLPVGEVDTFVERRKKFGIETWFRMAVFMASLQRMADGRVMAFDPDANPTDSTPENHYMALEEPLLTEAMLPNAKKRGWNEVLKFGFIALMVGIVVAGLFFLSVTMMDGAANAAQPVLNADGILVDPPIGGIR